MLQHLSLVSSSIYLVPCCVYSISKSAVRCYWQMSSIFVSDCRQKSLHTSTGLVDG
ncbi:MAG: hypothetical protein Q4B81_02750 [Moraxella sp.]|nr:hypothetical protein [Moraxella sp.]